jgi:hypothetical protein
MSLWRELDCHIFGIAHPHRSSPVHLHYCGFVCRGSPDPISTIHFCTSVKPGRGDAGEVFPLTATVLGEKLETFKFVGEDVLFAIEQGAAVPCSLKLMSNTGFA